MKDIKIVAILIIKEQYYDKFPAELKTLVEKSRKEVGCRHYELNQNAANPLEFIFLEHWDSAEALEKHNHSSHFVAFSKFASDKMISLDIKTITPYK